MENQNLKTEDNAPIHIKTKADEFNSEQMELIERFNAFAKKYDKVIHGVIVIKYPNNPFMMHFVDDASEVRKLQSVSA